MHAAASCLCLLGRGWWHYLSHPKVCVQLLLESSCAAWRPSASCMRCVLTPRPTCGLRKLGLLWRLVVRLPFMPCEHGLAAMLLPTIRSSSRWTSGMPSTPSVVTWCYEKCGSTSLPWPAGHPGATRQPAPCSLAVQPSAPLPVCSKATP